MKIVITGHTNGIGQALYDELSKEHEVQGCRVVEKVINKVPIYRNIFWWSQHLKEPK